MARITTADVPIHQRAQPRGALGRRLVVGAVAVAVAIGVLPGPRAAVARLLGIGTVRITADELPPDVGTALDLGRRTDLATALDEVGDLGAPVSLDAIVGDEPDAYTGAPIGAITLVWAPRDGLPGTGSTGVGLLLTVFPGTVGQPQVDKIVPPGTELEITEVDGAEAFWISGAEHGFAYVDPDGIERADSIRLAGNTLLWVVDGLTLRLESALDRTAAVSLAEDLLPR
jgi:hypothetical protein